MQIGEAANTGSGKTDIISTATNLVTTSLSSPGGGAPRNIAFTADGAFAYVTNIGTDKVMILNTATLVFDGNVAIGTDPNGITINR